MRDIKFRAWVNNSKKFEAIEFIGAGQKTFPVYTKGNKYWFPMQGILEQYTGLKDKNGVEIYEGDIICQQMRFVETNGVIFWQEDKSRFSVNLDGFITTVTKPQERSYEVIGNIHENADLLEEQ